MVRNVLWCEYRELLVCRRTSGGLSSRAQTRMTPLYFYKNSSFSFSETFLKGFIKNTSTYNLPGPWAFDGEQKTAEPGGLKLYKKMFAQKQTKTLDFVKEIPMYKEARVVKRSWMSSCNLVTTFSIFTWVVCTHPDILTCGGYLEKHFNTNCYEDTTIFDKMFAFFFTSMSHPSRNSWQRPL